MLHELAGDGNENCTALDEERRRQVDEIGVHINEVRGGEGRGRVYEHIGHGGDDIGHGVHGAF